MITQLADGSKQMNMKVLTDIIRIGIVAHRVDKAIKIGVDLGERAQNKADAANAIKNPTSQSAATGGSKGPKKPEDPEEKEKKEKEKKNAPSLPAPQMADHHIFPQQFKSYFSKKGIDIDLHTVSVPHKTTHLRGLHGNGNANMPGGWNQRWKSFIDNTPNASAKDVYQFAGKLMDEYGINHVALHGYKS